MAKPSYQTIGAGRELNSEQRLLKKKDLTNDIIGNQKLKFLLFQIFALNIALCF